MLANAGDRQLARGDVALPLQLADVDLLGDPAAARGGQHAALRLDLLEQLPGLLGELPRIPLDVPGPAGGIDDVVQMAFLGKDELGVPRIAPAQLRAEHDWSVEGNRGDGVGAGDGTGVAGRGVAQDVDRRAPRRQHAPARRPQPHDLGSSVAAARRDDLGP